MNAISHLQILIQVVRLISSLSQIILQVVRLISSLSLSHIILLLLRNVQTPDV